ncbi:MAG TPA: hypothetical protein VIV12_19185, partial [Streptosporangiaceae bacterium]
LWKTAATRPLFAKLKADLPLSAPAPGQSRRGRPGSRQPGGGPAPGGGAAAVGARTAAEDACK